MSLGSPNFVGVDGSPSGWIAVGYDDGFAGIAWYDSMETLWSEHREAETILVDMPIGLREDCGDARECDTAARELLSPDRHNSVFPVPIRAAVHEEEYEEAKEKQEERTDGSLGTQSHSIADGIRELDCLLRNDSKGRGTIRESHPEVCFAALAGNDPMSFSKSSQPAAAFWERVSVLESIDGFAIEDLQKAGESIIQWDNPECSNDDLLDAFALALTASDLTGDLQTFSEERVTDCKDLPMEMVYAEP